MDGKHFSRRLFLSHSFEVLKKVVTKVTVKEKQTRARGPKHLETRSHLFSNEKIFSKSHLMNLLTNKCYIVKAGLETQIGLLGLHLVGLSFQLDGKPLGRRSHSIENKKVF